MRYKESKDGDWNYHPAEGIALDSNENLLMCHDEEPSESISPECVSGGAASDFDFSMMGDNISYKDKTLTMNFGEGRKVWDEAIKDMQDEMDVTIYDAQNVEWECKADKAYDTVGDETAKVNDCGKVKVFYLKKESKDAKKCFSSKIAAMVGLGLFALY